MCEVDGVCFLKVSAGCSGCDGELKCSLWHFLSNSVHVPNKRQTISLRDEYVCGTNKPVKAISRVKELPVWTAWLKRRPRSPLHLPKMWIHLQACASEVLRTSAWNLSISNFRVGFFLGKESYTKMNSQKQSIPSQEKIKIMLLY